MGQCCYKRPTASITSIDLTQPRSSSDTQECLPSLPSLETRINQPSPPCHTQPLLWGAILDVQNPLVHLQSNESLLSVQLAGIILPSFLPVASIPDYLRNKEMRCAKIVRMHLLSFCQRFQNVICFTPTVTTTVTTTVTSTVPARSRVWMYVCDGNKRQSVQYFLLDHHLAKRRKSKRNKWLSCELDEILAVEHRDL
jgi:hypothetical protein